MSNLDKLLIELYPNQISEAESKEASYNLLNFFKELHKIDKRLNQINNLKQEQSIKNKSNNKHKNNSNLKMYENHKSSH